MGWGSLISGLIKNGLHAVEKHSVLIQLVEACPILTEVQKLLEFGRALEFCQALPLAVSTRLQEQLFHSFAVRQLLLDLRGRFSSLCFPGLSLSRFGVGSTTSGPA